MSSGSVTPEVEAGIRANYEASCVRYAMKHPKVLDILADCALCIDTENSATHEGLPAYDGSVWRLLATEWKAKAKAIVAEDPEIWEDFYPLPVSANEETFTLSQELQPTDLWARYPRTGRVSAPEVSVTPPENPEEWVQFYAKKDAAQSAAALRNNQTLVDFIRSTTHWREGKPDRHDAITALKELGWSNL